MKGGEYAEAREHNCGGCCRCVCVILVTFRHGGAKDWLGRCLSDDGKSTNRNETIVSQKCLNLVNCGEGYQQGCTSSAGRCPDRVTITVADDYRTIQTGDCVNSQSSDTCAECYSQKLICFVWYSYQATLQGACTNRCPTPTASWADGPPRCKP